MMTTNMIGRAACAIGLNSAVRRDKWTPNIAAPVVTEFEQTHTCKRCAKVMHHVHWRWNGEEMVDVVTPNVKVRGPTAALSPEAPSRLPGSAAD